MNLLLLLLIFALPDVARMKAHVYALTGVRKGGSVAERKAAGYCAAELKKFGFETATVPVPLPGGKQSLNVVGQRGRGRMFLLGAHIDSKPPSPGANDNASGVAACLEVARLYRGPLRVVFFGSEEVQDAHPDHHHYGSRHYVAHSDLSDLEGMICIDSVGAGPNFVIGTMSEESDLSRDLRRRALALGYPVQAMVDPGWSDHEPFFLAGVPTAYVRWRVDPALHTAADGVSHLNFRKVEIAARVVLAYLESSAR